MHRFAITLRRTSLLLQSVETFAACVLIVAFTLILSVNVFGRYVLNAPLFFAEELAVYILIWMAFLAAAASIGRGDLVRVSLVDALPPRFVRAIRLVVEILVFAMLAGMLYAAWKWFNGPAVAFEQALTLNMPKRPFLAIIPLFCGLSLLHTLSHIVEILVLDTARGTAR